MCDRDHSDDNKITFLNHSSLLVASSKTQILCDPWFRGAAFNNGWHLLHDESHDINMIECDYIWVSHEHPDHFSVPTLSQLKKPKNFLYQATKDKKVLNYLAKNGHSITELNDSNQYKINDLLITSFVSDGYDSAALFTFPSGEKFLNVNDARIDLGNSISQIKKCELSNLKLLSIQFSYANWAGNNGDTEIPLHQQNLVIERILKVFDAFKPEKIMLFASYAYHSHEDNFYCDKIFWLPYIIEKIKEKSINFIIPRPDQVINLKGIVDKDFTEENDLAVSFWKNKFNNRNIKNISNVNVGIEEVHLHYSNWYNRIWKNNKKSITENIKNKNFSLIVFLKDKNYCVAISLFSEKIKILNESSHDCEISSETLIFLLRNNFGRGTVTVNSRVQFNYETAHKFFIFFYIPYANNIGIYFIKSSLTSTILSSIKNTSAMISILKFNSKAILNCDRDINLFN